MADLNLFVDGNKGVLVIDGTCTELTLEEIGVLLEGLKEVGDEIVQAEIERRAAAVTANVIQVDPGRWGRNG